MRGLLELAREYLRLPASIGIPEDTEGISGTSISDPVYASVIGILMLSQKYGTNKRPFKIQFSLTNIINSLKALLKKVLP
jgi:cell division ATPase FtsA